VALIPRNIKKPDGSMWPYQGDGRLTHPFNRGVEIGAYGWQHFDRLI